MAELVDKFESRSAATLPDEGEGSSPTHRSRPRCLPSYVEDFSRSDPTSHGWHVPVVMTSSVTEFNLQRPSPPPSQFSPLPNRQFCDSPFPPFPIFLCPKKRRLVRNLISRFLLRFAPPSWTSIRIVEFGKPCLLSLSLSLSVFESRESLFTWKGSKIRPG